MKESHEVQQIIADLDGLPSQIPVLAHISVSPVLITLNRHIWPKHWTSSLSALAFSLDKFKPVCLCFNLCYQFVAFVFRIVLR
jgi:hypothetical protein